MNKTELIAYVAEETGLKKKEAEAAVNATLGGITKAIQNDDKVQLIGFGTFEVRTRKEREGRNPRDPEKTIKIPATKAPAFKPGKALKDLINK